MNAYRPLRTLVGLAAVGAAIAVGVVTHSVGFTTLAFFGTLWMPRILGISGHRGRRWGHLLGGPCHGHGGLLRGGREQQLREWHERAHGPAGTETPSASPA